MKDRFESKFIKSDGCWIWIGCLRGKAAEGNNYGSFKIGQTNYLAHRVSYTLYKGEIPEGLCVLHSCDNPLCVNPDHLSLGTHSQNMADMKNKSRGTNGEKSYHNKLKAWQVKAIRFFKEYYGYFNYELAEIYGVSTTTITQIVNRKLWKHI